MMRAIAVALALAACGTLSTPPDAALPTCPSLGCGDNGDSVCTSEGLCSCHHDTCERVVP